MTGGDTVDTADPVDNGSTGGRPSGGGLLLPVLVGLLVVALAAAVAMTVWLRGATDDREASEADRAAVVNAAERFTETWNTFEATDAEAYTKQVEPLLSTKFRAEFAKSAEAVISGITQQRLSSKGVVLEDDDEVPLVGVASMDSDSAVVLVVSDAQRVSNGQQVVRHWRWQVNLVKTDGQWLVDEFKEV